MNKRIIIILWLAMLFVSWGQAARLDTLEVKSPSMKGLAVEALAVVPDAALKPVNNNFPVLYLLHGYGGNAFSWITIKPELPEIADKNGIIIICPDARNSWYWDSPMDASSCFETFVAVELVEYIDNNYPTIAHKRGRAIAGLSMGGHGAMWLAFRHQGVFGAAGSMSGGLDIRPFADKWGIKKQLGEKSAYPDRWDKYTAINQIGKINRGDLALIIDCGYDDFFFKVNAAFHNKLLQQGIAHDYFIRPGAHTSDYWNNALDYQILFFKKYFDKNKSVF